MQQPDYIADAIKEAADRHGGAMYPHEIERQYREGLAKPKQELAPYAPIQKEGLEADMPDTGALTPSQKRGMTMFLITGSAVSAWVGFLQVCASGALNTVFQVGACVGVGMFLLSGLFSGGNSSGNSMSSNDWYSSRSGGGPVINNYYQNNFQGPNGQQTNQSTNR